MLPRIYGAAALRNVPYRNCAPYYSIFFRVRWNSQQPKGNKMDEARKAAIKAAKEKQDDLNRDWDAQIISFEDLKPKTESPSSDAYLIDVREPDEVAQGMIPSAVNIPLSIFGQSLHLPPDQFRNKFGFNKPKRDQEVTFYCRSGKRSSSAADVAKRNGWTNILNYKGSWTDWVAKTGGSK